MRKRKEAFTKKVTGYLMRAQAIQFAPSEPEECYIFPVSDAVQ